jgi:hypothetical protein
MTRDAEIRIERLALRMRGVSDGRARAALDGLGADVAGRLATAASAAPPARHELGFLALGTLRAPRGASAFQLRAAVAEAVAHSIARGLQGEGR